MAQGLAVRFHLVSLPHTQTTLAYSACAFTEKVRKFAIMMMDLGHEVFLYAGDQNEAPCTEHVVCFTEQDRLKHTKGEHFIGASWDYSLPAWRNMNQIAAEEIKKRRQPQDFVCIIGGLANKELADLLPDMMVVEFGIGYGGSFAKYRVFESYAWMHTTYGAQGPHNNPNAVDGRWYDAVIPGYFEVERFEHSVEKDDYFLYVGRMTQRKGLQVAYDLAQATGIPLHTAGVGDLTPPDWVTHHGEIGPELRNKLMSRARFVIVPTIYIEPFGNVAVEAQACGTPVLTTDWGAMTETVIDGATGYRCRLLREFVEAAEKVKTLDPQVIRQHALDNYSLPVIARKYEAYFERLLTLHGKGWYAA